MRFLRLAVLLLLSSALLSAQTYLNLNFESATSGGPAQWGCTGGYYQYPVDATVAFEGAQSLRISSLTTDTNVFGACILTVPADPAVGRTFHLTGVIRTQTVNGYAGFWANAGSLAFKDLGAAAPSGTTGWQRYELYMYVPAGATVINFGPLLAGTGTAWFDALTIDVDGTNLYYPDPRPAQVQWIKDHAIPFTSVDPAADLTELEPLKQVIGNARAVGIGEGTHGTSEFFRMKGRLVSFLAQEMGFTVFANEMDMAQASRINDYILTGRGDPREVLAGIGWVWNTQEYLDTIEWMRQYNASGKGPIQFFGVDIQDPSVSMYYVVQFVRQADPGLLPLVSSSYRLITPLNLPTGATSSNLAQYQSAEAAAQDVLTQLQANRSKYLKTMSATAVDWAIQNATVVKQSAHMGVGGGVNVEPGFRDSCMAANAEWIAEHVAPGSRMIFSAHNGHISRHPGSMGAALTQYFGQENYVTLATVFHSGTYRAGYWPITGTRDDVGILPALDSFPGSLEYFFHQTGTQRQILDLRLANASDPASGWLNGYLRARTAIGWAQVDGMSEFGDVVGLPRYFDALLFFDQATGAEGLPMFTQDLAVFAPVVSAVHALDPPYTQAPAPGAGTPAPLPDGIVGVTYTQALTAGGGSCAFWPPVLPACTAGPWPPYGNWTVSSGSLPPGLTLSSDGVLSGTPAAAGSFTFTVRVSDPANVTAQGQLSLTISAAAPPGLRFVPVTPCRVADTRSSGGPMAGGSARSFNVPQSGCGIPDTAQAYSLNVTAVPHGALPYLTLWPTGQAQPLVSTLNSFSGDVVANAAVVPAGTGGAVSVFVAGLSDVILDINGYFDSSMGLNSYSFYAAPPCRVADTRDPAGPFGGPAMPGHQSRDFAIPSSACNLPFYAGAYSLNVTVVPDGYLGYLSTWPAGLAQPNVSTLNSWTGKIVANAALVPAGGNGAISVYVTDPADVVLDTNGYFAQPGSAGALAFYPVPPCRVADTREPAGPFGGPILEPASTRSFPISGSCGIPAAAAAYSLNVTVVPDGPLWYLTAWPAGSAQPLVSTLNAFDGSVTANAAIVPAGANGAVSIFVAGRSHVVLDINGYFAP